METSKIRELADILNGYGLSVLELCEGETKIRLEKQDAKPQAPAAVLPTLAAEPSDALNGTMDFSGVTEVKSPIVGVFYAAPSPDAVPFTSIGSRVRKGDVLCIVEAMKLMNEITAEQDGEIVDICVKDGDIVEYGQVLFKLY